MSTQDPPSARTLTGVLGRGIQAPARLQTYRNLCYLLLLFPRGIAYFTFLLGGLLAGLGLVIVVVGVAIILLVLTVATGLAELERYLARVLLGVDVSADSAAEVSGLWTGSVRLVTDYRTWNAVVYHLSAFVFGTVVFGVLTSALATAWNFLTAPLYYRDAPVVAYGPIPHGDFTLDLLFGWDDLLVGLTTTFRLGSWQIETLPGALLVAGLGLVLLVATLAVVNALASLWGRYASAMLTVPRYWRSSDR